jgi:hypothetical protein
MLIVVFKIMMLFFAMTPTLFILIYLTQYIRIVLLINWLIFLCKKVLKETCLLSMMYTLVLYIFSFRMNTWYISEQCTRLEKALGISETVGISLVPRRYLSALGAT